MRRVSIHKFKTILDSLIVQPYCTALLHSPIVQPYCTALLNNLIVQSYQTALLYSPIVQPYCTALLEVLKFIYSEKATKFCKIFPLLLTTVHTVKSKGKISQNFVAFSEYINLNNVRFRSCKNR